MAAVVIERCVPSHRAAEIVSLFQRVGEPGFHTVFDRIYRRRERSGLRSWITLSEGQAVVHIAVSPLRFSDGCRSLVGGVLGDLMADPAQRDFWRPVGLVRRMVSDVRASRHPDFLLTSYVPAAEAVFRAAGFQPFGTLMRYVLPLIGPYLLLRGLQHGEGRPVLSVTPFREAGDPIAGSPGTAGCFRPVPDHDFYATRMPRIQYPAGWWLTAGSPDAPDAQVLVSARTPEELVVADVVWREEFAALAGLLSSVGRWAADQGHRRLTLTTMEGSALADAGHRAGFLRRPDPLPLLLLSTNPSAEVPPPSQWSLTPFALSTW